jgi:hypothetical protein
MSLSFCQVVTLNAEPIDTVPGVICRPPDGRPLKVCDGDAPVWLRRCVGIFRTRAFQASLISLSAEFADGLQIRTAWVGEVAQPTGAADLLGQTGGGASFAGPCRV